MNFENHYDYLYKQVTDFLEKANPCNICNGECTRKQNGGKNFCCGENGTHPQCKYLGANGCTADSPLLCKHWLCDSAYKKLSKSQKIKYHFFNIKIEELLGENPENRFFRASKQDVLKIILMDARKVNHL